MSGLEDRVGLEETLAGWGRIQRHYQDYRRQLQDEAGLEETLAGNSLIRRNIVNIVQDQRRHWQDTTGLEDIMMDSIVKIIKLYLPLSRKMKRLKRMVEESLLYIQIW